LLIANCQAAWDEAESANFHQEDKFMKINVEVDCTPEEARSFLGLPDVKPIQDAMSEHIQERVQTAMTMFDPETLLKTWFPMGSGGAGSGGMDQFQNAFKTASEGMTGGGKKEK
jgi:hypothetical protein